MVGTWSTAPHTRAPGGCCVSGLGLFYLRGVGWSRGRLWGLHCWPKARADQTLGWGLPAPPGC